VSTLFLASHPGARAVVGGTFVAGGLGEWFFRARGRLAGAVPPRAGLRARARISLQTVVQALRTRDPASDRGTKWILVGALVAGVALALVVARNDVGPGLPGSGWALVVAGVAVMSAGIVLRLWAIAVLGRFFRVVVIVQEGHRVISDGPYRVIRHPAYTGLLLVAAGYGVALGSLLGLVCAVVIPFLGMLPRILVEEAELERGLGDDYRRYEQETWRLVPHVW
jgi:protein-S-isoprenylcysteine O-methyltransferase Ste14